MRAAAVCRAALLAVAASSGAVRSDGADAGASHGGSTTVWDYVVVGAGTGGSLCAARLAAAGFDTLLLEAGKWDGEWLYGAGTSAGVRNARPNVWAYPARLPGRLSVQNSKDMRSQVAAGKIAGGSSAVHNDIFDPPPAGEFEHRGLLSWSGAAVRAALDRIQADLTLSWSGEEDLDNVPDAQFYIVSRLLDGMPLAHLPRGSAGESGSKAGLAAGWTMFRSRAGGGASLGPQRRHTSYGDLVPPLNGSRASAEGERRASRPLLTVVAGALAARVLLEPGQEPGAHEAVGVEWRRHGVSHEAFARHAVMLAAGAIGTPKVLTLSGIGDPLELQRLGVPVKVANREVGRELADHLAMFTWLLLAGLNTEDGWLEGPDCKAGEKFNVFFNMTGPPSGGDGRIDAEVRFFTSCNETRKTVDFGVEAVLLHPESRGRVFITSASPEALPSVEFPALWPNDYARLEAIYVRLADVLGMSPEDFTSEKHLTLAENIRREAYLYQHFCCSARAAPAGEPGVCGEDLQVRGVRGLFVADASALPATPSSHTSAPTLVVGELAAASALRLHGEGGERPLPARAREAAETQTREARAALLEETQHEAPRALGTPSVPLRRRGGAEGVAAVELPLVGLGTGTLSGAGVAGTIATFVQAGGRHLDLATMYDNYGEVRTGIEASGLESSSDVVLTWKVMPLGAVYVRQALEEAMTKLGVGFVHIALLHWPGDITSGKLLHGRPPPACVQQEQERPGPAGTVHSWRACRLESYAELLAAERDGRVRAVGVSNFAARHLDDLASGGLAPPAVHQLEMHPMWHDDELLRRSGDEGTVIQAYGCLGGKHTGAPLIRQEGFQKIAARRNITPAQVLLRWAVQRGAAVITGGSTEDHIASNLNIFGFELDQDEMDFANAIDPEAMRKMYGPHPEEIL